MIAPDQILAHKYRVDRVLGAGGMGTVLAATHLQLDQRVAIKVLLPQLVTNESATTRFVREARFAARLTTEHVARVLDVGVLDDGAPYIVMEYLEGLDLAALLAARGPLPTELAVDYALQILQAMAEAHRIGIVHRDLKPANCFVTRRADGSNLIKVLDFGIAKAGPGDPRLTHSAALLGTPRYMSPEQIRAAHAVDPRSDLWALGVILFELISGRPPFLDDSFAALAVMVLGEPMPPLPGPPTAQRSAFEAVIRRCLEKDPAARFQNVAELAAALVPFGPPGADAAAQQVARILGRAPTPVREEPARQDAGTATTCSSAAGVAPIAPRRSRRPPLFRVGAAMLLASALGAAGLVITLRDRAATPSAPPSTPSTPSQPAGIPAPADAPDPILAKLEGYIACVNEFSEHTFSNRASYLRWGFAATGTRESKVLSPGKIPDPTGCAAKVAAARSMPPSEPELEQAGDAYAAALRVVFPLLLDADDYYTQDLYKDDGYAKAKTLHPQLMAAFDTFATADGKLRAQLRLLGRAARARELARIEAREGRSLRFCSANVLLCASDLVELAHAPSVSKIDGAALSQAIDACKPAIAELDAAATRRWGTGEVTSAGTVAADVYQLAMYTRDMIDEAKKLLRRAKELARHVAGTVHYTEFELRNLDNSDLVEGSPAGMIDAYNRLVQAANHRPKP